MAGHGRKPALATLRGGTVMPSEHLPFRPAEPTTPPGWESSNRLKIAMLTDSVSLSGGGPPAMLRSLCQTMQRSSKISVQVFALQRDIESDREGWGDVPVHLAPVQLPRGFGYSRSLRAALYNSDADLLHVHGLWLYTSVLARQWAADTKKPYVVSTHGMLDPWALCQSRWKKRIAMHVYERAHLLGAACLHALCDAEIRSIRSLGLRTPVCRIPTGANLPENSPSLPAWRTQLPSNARILLYFGRLTPKKGPAPLLRAWASVQSASPTSSPWHLVFVGPGPEAYRAELRSLAADLHIEETVHFVGFVPDKVATFASADAFVLPSISEGMPGAALEAWAQGLPSLLTAQCNLPEGFNNGAAIRIAPDELGIAAGIRRLMQMTDDDRKAMGARGRTLVAKQFSWPVIAAQLEDVYRWLLGLEDRPPTVDLI